LGGLGGREGRSIFTDSRLFIQRNILAEQHLPSQWQAKEMENPVTPLGKEEMDTGERLKLNSSPDSSLSKRRTRTLWLGL